MGSQDITIGSPNLQPCLHTDQGKCTVGKYIFKIHHHTVTLNVYTVDHRSCELVVTRAAIAKDVQYRAMKELGLPSSNYQLCEVKSSGGIQYNVMYIYVCS